MSDTHRKIELQSPEDLRYLIDNARRAANEKIDRAFPPMANQGEDAMKLKVKELVDEYITQTFQTATPNISINGLPATLPPSQPLAQTEEYAPLNTKLQARALELARKEEDLLIEIAALRREAPLKAVANNKAAFKEGVDGDEEALKSLLEKARAADGKGTGIGDVEGTGEGTEETWRRGVDELGRLRDELPGTAQRLEKARKAGEYVKNEG